MVNTRKLELIGAARWRGNFAYEPQRENAGWKPAPVRTRRSQAAHGRAGLVSPEEPGPEDA